MSKRKKIAIMLIVILAVQILFPILTVVFESKITLKSIAVTSGDWKYTINDDGETITIVEYSGTETDLQIPSEIDGYTVTALGGNITYTSRNRRSWSVLL